jgi:hypothetical protein
MTTFNLTCEAVEASLAEYLDETLEPWVRTAIEEHLARCARCTALAHELRNIVGETASLPALHPDRDIWPAVADRIGATGISPEPVEQSAPSESALERVVFASDTFLPIDEQPEPQEEPRSLTTDSALFTSEANSVTSEPALSSDQYTRTSEPVTREPASPVRATPPLTKEPVPKSEAPSIADDLPVPKSEAPAIADDLPVPKTEAPAIADDLPLPTRTPSTPAIEPPQLSRTPLVPTTGPAPAVDARREKRWGPLQIGLAAAALVLVTATTSSVLTVRLLGRTGTPIVVSTVPTGKAPSGQKRPSEKSPSAERAPAERSVRRQSTEPEPVVPDLSTPAPAVPPVMTVSAAAAPAVPASLEEGVYDREIKSLSRIVRGKQASLDPSTVAVIDKNLLALDSASAQIRTAREIDPSSSLLDAQASRALEMKVELLRRAAMMRSITSL